jgi:hypothetical protein
VATAAVLSVRFRLPAARRAMLTAFFTKFRSSVARSGQGSGGTAHRPLFVMQAERPEECKSGAPDELLATLTPPGDLVPSMRRAVKQMEAPSVADRPVIEVVAPATHWRRRQPCRVSHEGNQQARLVIPVCQSAAASSWFRPSCLPSALMSLTDTPEGTVRRDGEMRHPLARGFVAVAFQPFQDGAYIVREG